MKFKTSNWNISATKKIFQPFQFTPHFFLGGGENTSGQPMDFRVTSGYRPPPCKDFTFTMQGKRPGSSGKVTLIPRTGPRRFFRSTEKSSGCGLGGVANRQWGEVPRNLVENMLFYQPGVLFNYCC